MNIRLLIISISLLILPAAQAQKLQCTFEVDGDINLFNGSDHGVNPGDIICVKPGFRNFIQFRNVHGTENNPVQIVNKEGLVIINSDGSYGIKFNNCSHIVFSGSGFETVPYGFIIASVENGAGLSIDNLSTNVEIEKVEISNVPIAGIYAKTEPDPEENCTFPAVRERFTMYDVSIHDCYLHDIGNEGFYIGSSKYLGQTVQCNGEDTTVLPHLIEGVRVYNNVLENIGWDAIQVSSAISDCKIYGNLIMGDSYAEEIYQMSGILIGGGSQCDCYNNIIKNGKGDGIDLLGMGGDRIYNNLIIEAGRTYQPNDSTKQKHGIWVGDIATDPDLSYYIYNNTIIRPKTYGIKLSNTNIAANYIQNNIILDPGGYSSAGNDAYLNLLYPGINILENNNLKTLDLNSVRFVNPSLQNFDLKAQSPAVNAGIDMQWQGLFADIENRPRPFDKDFDIGAYECQDSSLLSIQENYFGGNKLNISNCYPLPFDQLLTIEIQSEDFVKQVEINLLDSSGTYVGKIYSGALQAGKNILHFDLGYLNHGTYILEVRHEDNVTGKRIIKQGE